MRAARPAARTAHTSRKLREPFLDPDISRLRFLAGGDPAYPLVACQRSDVLPHSKCGRSRKKCHPPIRWQGVHGTAGYLCTHTSSILNLVVVDMKYKALVFDFFGVLCTDISTFWFKQHFAEKGNDLRHQYLRSADRGEISEETLFKELATMAGVSPEEVKHDWESHISFNTELTAFIKELKSSYKIGVLSNATSPDFHTIMALSGTLGLFDQVVVSSDIGHIKPEPEIYQAMLARLGVEPSEALMIDDAQANVDGAIGVGMAGHRYVSVADLRQFLAAVR